MLVLRLKKRNNKLIVNNIPNMNTVNACILRPIGEKLK